MRTLELMEKMSRAVRSPMETTREIVRKGFRRRLRRAVWGREGRVLFM
jgi:hypothetical protein